MFPYVINEFTYQNKKKTNNNYLYVTDISMEPLQWDIDRIG